MRKRATRRAGGADDLGQIQTGHVGRGLGQCNGLGAVGVGQGLARGQGQDAAVLGAVGAQAAREGACIEAGNGHGAFALEVSVQGFLAAEIGRQEGQVFDDQASCVDAIGLHVFAVGAGVANVRVREGDDLSAVAGIGEDFLVAGQRGVEDDFACGVTRGADGNPGKDRAVGERDKGFRVDGQHGNLQKKAHSQAGLDT